MIGKIITGGQTGVDRAGLDVAINLNISYGGWCPKGRIDELGIIPKKYRALKEISGDFKTEKENYDARTKRNIKDSDGTLIIIPKFRLPSNMKDGTQLTISEAKNQSKPLFIIKLFDSAEKNSESIVNWIKENQIKTLNIGGPRESSSPGIYKSCFAFLEAVLPCLVFPTPEKHKNPLKNKGFRGSDLHSK